MLASCFDGRMQTISFDRRMQKSCFVVIVDACSQVVFDGRMQSSCYMDTCRKGFIWTHADKLFDGHMATICFDGRMKSTWLDRHGR